MAGKRRKKQNDNIKHKGFKFEIYPTEEQKKLILHNIHSARAIYNIMLADKIAYYEEHNEMFNNTPAMYKKDHPWLKDADSLALINAQNHLDDAFKNFFERPKSGFPRFKSRRYFKKSYTTNCVNGNIKLENNTIKLPKISAIKIKIYRIIPDDYKLKSVTVSVSPTGRYFVSILFEYESQVPDDINLADNPIGLDYSMSELYLDSNGHKACFTKYYRKSQVRMARLQRQLAHMQYGSANYYKQKRKIAILHEKIANQRKDFLHKKSRELADKYTCVIIEDLDMSAMKKRSKSKKSGNNCKKGKRRFGKSVSDNGWGMFTTFLNYKLENAGKKLIKINKFFPSSQLCNNCGYQNPETKDLSVREWTCPVCHTFHDRDVNAAINIKNEGLRMLASISA
jgi:putative transposase